MLLAQAENKRLKTAALARQRGASRPFSRPVLQFLEKAGFLHSAKGKGSGFWLKNLTLQDLLALNDPVSFPGKKIH